MNAQQIREGIQAGTVQVEFSRCADMRCPWCADPASDYEPADPEAELCRPHLAEWEGLSLDGLDRMEAEEAADLL